MIDGCANSLKLSKTEVLKLKACHYLTSSGLTKYYWLIYGMGWFWGENKSTDIVSLTLEEKMCTLTIWNQSGVIQLSSILWTPLHSPKGVTV